VEIADMSLAYDQKVKLPRFAAAGIAGGKLPGPSVLSCGYATMAVVNQLIQGVQIGSGPSHRI
jgi:hypothetical protein